VSPRSENLRLRLPKAIGDRLHEMAAEQGVPMNTIVNLLLAEALGFRFRDLGSTAEEAMPEPEAVDLPGQRLV
jgi:HicB family